MNPTIIILILSLVLGVSLNYFIILITYINKKQKRLKTDILNTIKGLERAALDLTSGNVSHKRGTILNSCNHINLIIERK